MIKIYGIKSCDTCRKARKWLDQQGIEARYVDLREDGVAQKDIARWIKARGRDAVLNRRSTTWRALAAREREGLDDARAAALMAREPTLIKRPVFEADGKTVIGFDDAARAALRAAAR